MKYVIVGGSNSLISEGWVSKLIKIVGSARVLNLSIGASPSMMAYYRLVTCDELCVGDVVVWEYAINDEEFILTHGARMADLIKYVHLVAQHCAKKGMIFMPIILKSKDNSETSRSSPYEEELIKFFEVNSISYLSFRAISDLISMSAARMSTHFKDRVHLRVDSPILDVIPDWIVKHSVTFCVSQVSHCTKPLLLSKFMGHIEEACFSSKLGFFTAQFPDVSGQGMRVQTPPEGDHKIIGCVVMRTLLSGPLIMSSKAGDRGISLKHQRPWFPKPIIVFSLVDNTKSKPIFISEKSPIFFKWGKYRPNFDQDRNSVGGVLSVLTERVS